MGKRSLGAKIFGIAFILTGLFFFSWSFDFIKNHSNKEHVARIDSVIERVIRDGDEETNSEEFQSRLSEKGNLEIFKGEYSAFKLELIEMGRSQKDQFKKTNAIMLAVTLVTIALFILTGLSILFYNRASVKLVLICGLFFILYQGIPHVSICEAVKSVHHIGCGKNRFNELAGYVDSIDPNDCDSQDLCPAFLFRVLSSPKLVLFHSAYAILFIWALFYLTKPKVKEQFK